MPGTAHWSGRPRSRATNAWPNRWRRLTGRRWLQTKSGHIEPSSLKKQHARACRENGVEPFDFYTLCHTWLAGRAPHMDPWTLAYLTGHRDMSITKRFVHPQEQTIRAAMDRARSGHIIGHTRLAESPPLAHTFQRLWPGPCQAPPCILLGATRLSKGLRRAFLRRRLARAPRRAVCFGKTAMVS